MVKSEHADSISAASDIQNILGVNQLAEMLDKETTVIFLLPLDISLRYPEQSRIFTTLEDEPAHWVNFTNGKNFVGMEFWKVPDAPDRYIRQDVIAQVVAQHLLTQNPLMKYPALGGEYEDISPIEGTLVELATAISIESPDNTQAAISNAFDRCLYELNTFLRAYRNTSTNPNIRPLTRQTCRPLIPMLFQRASGEYYNHSLFVTHAPISSQSYPTAMSDQELWNLSVSLSRHKRNDPFSVWADLTRSANRYYLVEGDYAACVITCQTAYEVLLNTILLCLGWESKRERNATRSWTHERTPFLTRVTKYLQPIVKGNWSLISADFKLIAKSRNKIVHNAEAPGESDARECLAALSRLEAFIKERLAAGRRNYPRTALLLLGTPGLEKRNAWDPWMQRWVDENAHKEPDWILEFMAWRES